MQLWRTSVGAGLVEVAIPALSPTRFLGTAEPDQYSAFMAAAERAQGIFRGRVIWNVNSTPQGGGVAEMLRPLLGYTRGAGVDTRWLVIGGDPAFFRVTKRVHNHLHGAPGDGGGLDRAEHDAYLAALEPNARALSELLHPDDLVVLHDPQTAGLVPTVRSAGARAIWRCHVGTDEPNELVRGAWRFLAPFLTEAHAYVFSRRDHVWDILDAARVRIIPPSIDAFSPKNCDLDAAHVAAILAAAGVVGSHRGRAPHFIRSDGSPGRVDRRASVLGGRVSPGTPLVVQVSRWDHLKDPVGVLEGFVEHLAPRHPDAGLALVGPEVAAVSDDPEGAVVLTETSERWHGLAADVRARVHLVTLPMADVEVNATVVNAIQRHAAVVVQKSLAEGFGLTVAEAMWKSRPVVGGRVGGIQDQIEDGVTGLLVDTHDLAAFGAAVAQLLSDPPAAARMGEQARESVRRHFLGPRHLLQYLDLVAAL